jgi:hypothetical protein
MAQQFVYHRPGLHLEFYSEIYDYSEQHVNGESGIQPPMTRELVAVACDDPLIFAEEVPDIRGFAVNTPKGNTLATVSGFLADTVNSVLPYAYICTPDGRTLVVPTNQFMFYPDNGIVTLEGGIDALRNCPEAKLNAEDAAQADQYWGAYRRQNAA